MRKKILYVVTKSNWGGAQRYVFDLATHLPNDMYEVSVLYGGTGTLSHKLKEKNIRAFSIEKMWRDIDIFKEITSFLRLVSVFTKERPNIVHLNSSKAAGLGSLAARLAGIKTIVFTVHGWAFNENRPVWQKYIIKFLSWLTILFSTQVICITHKELERVKNWPLCSKKLSLIYNGIESPLFIDRTTAQQKIATLLNISPDILASRIVICSIAELTNNKGIAYAIEALKLLSESKQESDSNLSQHVNNINNKKYVYIIIGDGEEHQKFAEYIHKEHLDQTVFLAGFVKDASTLLKAFNIFLLPSLKEGLPYVIIEAGFASVPVIATDVGGIAEIIIHEKSGILIEPKNPKIIADSIIKYSDPSLQSNYSQALYSIVTKDFSLKTMLENTIAVYEKK